MKEQTIKKLCTHIYMGRELESSKRVTRFIILLYLQTISINTMNAFIYIYKLYSMLDRFYFQCMQHIVEVASSTHAPNICVDDALSLILLLYYILIIYIINITKL